jgi:hypothetical protein
MSLAEFQRAFADLISSPQRVLAARLDAGEVLRRYALDAREHRRLTAMINDPGMSINCTLYRVNRFTPLYAVLPLTCDWLGARLSTELDAFWASSRDATLQYGPESHRFGLWLQERIEAGVLPPGPIEDAIRLELAAFEVRTTSSALPSESYPHPRKRLLRFTYPTAAVLHPGSATSDVPAPPAQEWVLLDATGDALRVNRLDPVAGEALAQLD